MLIDPNYLVWRKSTYSGSTDCVELARVAEDVIVLRQSHDPGKILVFTQAEVDAFTAGVLAGEFSDL